MIACGVAACGGRTHDGSAGALSSDGSSASSAGASGASPLPPAPPSNVAPLPAAAQSPVPEDAPCTVAPGAPTLLYAGHPESFAIDGTFLYSAEYTGLSRVRLTGGAPALVTSTVDLRGATGSFVLGGGFIYFDPDVGMLMRGPIAGDAFVPPFYVARSSPYAAMAFDGLNVYSGQTDTGMIRRWPVDGSPEVDTVLPTGAYVAAIVAAPDAAYAALLSVSNGGGTTTGSVVKVPKDKSGLVTIADNVGEPSAISVDDQYVYFAATRGGLQTGALYRMGFDGSGLIKLSEPSPMAIAVDKHSVFFLRNSLIYKVDKAAGGMGTKVGPAQEFGGVLVNGGNVYWSGAVDMMGSVSAGVWTACK
jgi:hypothetical protein